MGSPPRVRGKGGGNGNTGAGVGITPACAGKRSTSPTMTRHIWDHPRVCGEKKREIAAGRDVAGSPPRVRGKAKKIATEKGINGITPACAGKSRFHQVHHRNGQDHPRVCGEKLCPQARQTARAGSPPRVRGKAQEQFRHVTKMGITPACAGKRLKRSHSIGHFSCILCLFHSVLHRASVSGGSRAGPCAPPCLPAQNAVPV